MLAGLMMLALPIGIVSKAFADEIHRREFVVTWGMLARVPLFSSLSAAEIAEVMDYLHALTAPAGSLIVRRGEPGACVYSTVVGAAYCAFADPDCANSGLLRYDPTASAQVAGTHEGPDSPAYAIHAEWWRCRTPCGVTA